MTRRRQTRVREGGATRHAQLDTEMGEPKMAGDPPAGGVPPHPNQVGSGGLCAQIFHWRECMQRLRAAVEQRWAGLPEARQAELQARVKALGWEEAMLPHVINLDAYPALCMALGAKNVENSRTEHTGLFVAHVNVAPLKKSSWKSPLACCLEVDPGRLAEEGAMAEFVGTTPVVGFLEPVGQHGQLSKQDMVWIHRQDGMPVPPPAPGHRDPRQAAVPPTTAAQVPGRMIVAMSARLNPVVARSLAVRGDQSPWGTGRWKAAGLGGAAYGCAVAQLLGESAYHGVAQLFFELEDEFRALLAQPRTASGGASGVRPHAHVPAPDNSKDPPPEAQSRCTAPSTQRSALSNKGRGTGKTAPAQPSSDWQGLRTRKQGEPLPTVEEVVASLRKGERGWGRGASQWLTLNRGCNAVLL